MRITAICPKCFKRISWESGKFKHNCGFTLIELMIIVAIIGILAAIALTHRDKQSGTETTERVVRPDLVSHN